MNISGQIVDLLIFRVKSTGLAMKMGIIHFFFFLPWVC